MMRLLVTGARGFVGRHCLAALRESPFEVHAVTRHAGKPAGDRVQWHGCDLLKPGGVERLVERVRPTHCLHLAWITAPGRYWHDDENLKWVAASLKLAQVFADVGGRRLVIAGSCFEYMPDARECAEMAMNLNPHTLYGRSKHALHLMLSQFADQHGMSLAWSRLFYVFGPEQEPTRLVPSVARALLAGNDFECRAPQQVCDYIHIADAASAFVRLVESDARGGFNVSSGTGHSVADIARRIGDMLGRPELIKMASTALAGTESPSFVGHPRRLREELGWAPQFDVDAGLRHTLAALEPPLVSTHPKDG